MSQDIRPRCPETSHHRTRSYTNPYVEITVDQNSVIREGHGSHTGGVFPAAGWGDDAAL